MCLFCRPPSVFSSQPATQAWWLTADCRCQSMLPLFAGAATINCINCDKLSDAHPLSHGPGFHYQSHRLVQLTVLRHHWPVDATSAVGAECCRQADHWQSTMWPQLHWLPVWQRVSYKIVTFVHRCLSSHVPSYLADDCRLVTDDCVLPTLHWLSAAHKVLLVIEHLLR